MSDNIVNALVKGTSTFNPIWRILLRLCLLGWFLAVIAGFTGLMAVWWFAVWVIPLSTALFAEAILSFLDTLDDNNEDK